MFRRGARLCDAGCTFEGNSTSIVFSHLNSDKLYVCRQSKSNELWTVRPMLSTTCLSVSTDVMHQRLGHLHSAALRRFCKDGGKSLTLCKSCVLAKSHRHPFQSSMPQADKILYRVHSDVIGPFQTPTPSGNQYLVSFINECSRYARIYLLKRKDEVFDAFRKFLSEAERHTGNNLRILQCDRGGEYSSSQFRAFTASHGIKLEQGPAHTPKHNSVAKRYNRTVMEQCRAQMIHAGIPNFLWGEFVMATSHILNLSPTRSAPDIPADAWQKACAGTGAHLSDHSFLRLLGCQALMHVPKTQRRKLDPCAKDLILVGYKSRSKSYQLWDPPLGRLWFPVMLPLMNPTSHFGNHWVRYLISMTTTRNSIIRRYALSHLNLSHITLPLLKILRILLISQPLILQPLTLAPPVRLKPLSATVTLYRILLRHEEYLTRITQHMLRQWRGRTPTTGDQQCKSNSTLWSPIALVV